MDSNLINLTNISDAKISISQNVFDKKFELLGCSSAITAVRSFEDQESATQALNSISKLLKDVEAARKAVKSPVLELGKKIDELAKNFTGELESEKNRISRLIGNFVAEQERKRFEEERRLREEAERKRKEEEESLSKAQKEVKAKGEEPPSSPQSQTVSVPVTPVFQRRKVAGQRIIKVRRFVITDVNHLHKAHPELFSPDESKIREFVRDIELAPGEVDEGKIVAGLKLWDETKAI